MQHFQEKQTFIKTIQKYLDTAQYALQLFSTLQKTFSKTNGSDKLAQKEGTRTIKHICQHPSKSN